MERGRSFMADKAEATADFGGKNISYPFLPRILRIVPR